MPIVNRIAALHGDITEWRHDLHAHPELLYDVHRTAAVVAEKLKSFGCDEVVTGIGRTGVVGVIRGNKPASGPFKTIGMRVRVTSPAELQKIVTDERAALARHTQATP